MCYNGQSRVLQVEPGGDLAVGHQEDVTDPRSKLFNRA